uniref:Uncharacterized protein n=2 Tax=Oryza sativa subsp. japonica TaxID=39947 RepID=Q5VM61_ORYSJ|nr:hypothetical protein [Oryza sativa Japonica Group]BAD69464.1 hypothetical protein [Oryza sativa Japonica Group]
MQLASQPDSWGCPPCPARPWAGPTREEAVLLQLPTQPDAAEHQQLQAAQHQQLQAPQRPGVVACADGSTGRGLGGERENGQGRFELRPAGGCGRRPLQAPLSAAPRACSPAVAASSRARPSLPAACFALQRSIYLLVHRRHSQPRLPAAARLACFAAADSALRRRGDCCSSPLCGKKRKREEERQRLANGMGKSFPTHQKASLNSNHSFSLFHLILTLHSFPNLSPTLHFPLSKHTQRERKRMMLTSGPLLFPSHLHVGPTLLFLFFLLTRMPHQRNWTSILPRDCF